MTTVRDQLQATALARGLRRSTWYSYERLLTHAGLIDRDVATLDREALEEAVWTLGNPNTRRACVIAIRSVLGVPLPIPRAVPRRYTLPDETTLRLALMTSPHELRGLLMMYAGLRVGEACAITRGDVSGDRLRVTRQMQELQRTGYPTEVKLAPVKTRESDVVIPYWLAAMVSQIDPGDMPRPMSVRESLRRAGVKVGVRLNPHMLRHWYATTLLARGVPLSLVSEQMRHSDVSVTLRAYSQHSTQSIHDVLGRPEGS